jgi:hypothetical protein
MGHFFWQMPLISALPRGFRLAGILMGLFFWQVLPFIALPRGFRLAGILMGLFFWQVLPFIALPRGFRLAEGCRYRYCDEHQAQEYSAHGKFPYT